MRGYASLFTVMLTIAAATATSRADEPLKPEQVKKAYDDALVQLRAAQDRKVELAKENEALTAKVEEMKKQLAASQAETEGLKREMAEADERTFYLRSYHAAWQNFIRQYPEMLARWKVYLGTGSITVPPQVPDVVDWNAELPTSG